MKFFEICGVKVSVTTIPQACAAMEDWIKNRQKAYVCVAPVSTIVDCQSDPEYRDIVNKADMVTPDGMPVVWIGKWLGHQEIERTYGPDLMETFCGLSQDKGYKHFLYGGAESTCQLLESVLKKRFPKISIVGRYSPPFMESFVPESREIIENMNRLDPDVIWVGLGSPKQDYWINYHRKNLEAPVILGVGAAFDFLSGAKKQAPRWMQKSGLEWLFRLCSEPKRLWRRYLLGNTKFIFYVSRDFFSKRLFR